MTIVIFDISGNTFVARRINAFDAFSDFRTAINQNKFAELGLLFFWTCDFGDDIGEEAGFGDDLLVFWKAEKCFPDFKIIQSQATLL